ncbi:glycosyltransferase family 4 protein [Flavivirga amylovorans]|uniref:Glycosyltransferase family 4 protein n=1 Tax=Flavivirga amylovorans TaxID=870486 RepID=A0ABT8X1T3_9FLAO|nr:glycosyltransferase family 4 protein [Flavivirga amylovorans]MDO5987876.1 glycosyltransferase family 4 protein [Flavivirga amylovorans]
MKLLYITNGVDGSGGLERVLSIKASYLVDVLGYDVDIITLNQLSSSLFYNFSDKISFHNIKANGNVFKYIKSYISGIRNKVKEIKPDIILVCDDGLKGFFLPRLLGKSSIMIYERHASKDIIKKTDTPNIFQKLKFKVLNLLMHKGAKAFNAFVVLTNDNLNEWPLKNSHVIANPLSFYPEERAPLAKRKVISVGNHGFQKGYDRLLESWKLVVSKYPNWNLEIYGKIDAQKKHIKLADDLGIKKNISFFNPVKNIQDKYREASIYAMSSRSEGFGMVLIEAMAFGLPCVAYDCPCGPKDIITENKDGFLIENGNINEFANKLILLIKEQELRSKMGLNARETAKKYLAENIMLKWEELFKNLKKQNTL